MPAEPNVYAPPATADPALAEPGDGPLGLTWAEVRRLRNASHSIRALGAVWCIAVAILALVGTPHFGSEREGVLLAVIGLTAAVLLAGCYCAWFRPAGGRVIGLIACALTMLQIPLEILLGIRGPIPRIPLGTLIGILGLIAFARSRRLFGPQRITHRQISAAYREMKAAQRR